jgi:ribosome recycling factor
MQPLTRQLQSHSRRILISSHFTANPSVRCIATQCIRNSSPEAARCSNSAPLSRTSHNLPLRSSPAIPHSHPFSTSPLLRKYKGPKAVPPPSSSLPSDPYSAENVEPGFTQLDDDIRSALDRYSKSMATLRSGGRINPLAIESLRAVVDKASKETVRVGDLAQVIPKGGRMLQILVGEEEVSLFVPFPCSLSLSLSCLGKFSNSGNPVRQTRLLCHHILRTLAQPTTRPAQPSPAKRRHPTADQGIPPPVRAICQVRAPTGIHVGEKCAVEYEEAVEADGEKRWFVAAR